MEIVIPRHKLSQTMKTELPSWMTPVDRDILECLYNEGSDELVLAPAAIADNTDWGAQTIREHLLTLRAEGLVKHYDESRGVYMLSNEGRAFVSGE